MKRRNFLSKWLLGVLFAAVTAHSGVALAAKGVIRVHEADWTGNVAMVRMVQFILEEEMGYKTKKIFLPAGPAVYEAVLGGEIDVAFEFWPSHSPIKEKYLTKWGGDGSIEYYGPTGFIGNSGWYAPRYVSWKVTPNAV